jgi:hypothetical protein
MEPYHFCKPDSNPAPHQSEKQNPDQHYNQKQDMYYPDPHFSKKLKSGGSSDWNHGGPLTPAMEVQDPEYGPVTNRIKLLLVEASQEKAKTIAQNSWCRGLLSLPFYIYYFTTPIP